MVLVSQRTWATCICSYIQYRYIYIYVWSPPPTRHAHPLKNTVMTDTNAVCFRIQFWSCSTPPKIPKSNNPKNPTIQKSKTFYIHRILQFYFDFWILGFLDFWFGSLDFWIFGFIDFWIFGMLDFWVLVFWILRLVDICTPGSAFRCTVGARVR